MLHTELNPSVAVRSTSRAENPRLPVIPPVRSHKFATEVHYALRAPFS